MSYLTRRVGDRALAEDILQDAFVRNMSRVDDVREETVVPWFYRTLRNAAIDHYRRQHTKTKALTQFAKEIEGTRIVPDLQHGVGAGGDHARGAAQPRARRHDAAVPRSLVVIAPILAFMVAEFFPGQPLHRLLPGGPLNWIELALATPVVLWGGWPFFQRGWASVVSRHLNSKYLLRPVLNGERVVAGRASAQSTGARLHSYPC